jgi:hypothetical protein
MIGARHDFDEETVAKLLRELPPAPSSWVQAAKELPDARREFDGIVERARAAAADRGNPLCEIDHKPQEIQAAGRHASSLRGQDLARTTGGTMGSEEGRQLREEDEEFKKGHRSEDVEGHVADPEGRLRSPEVEETKSEGEGFKKGH